MSATTTRIAIIGAGHSGICLGMLLRRAGIDDFVILEKAATLGGTWRDNTYPGASCDAPSFLYSFSFAQKTDWSRRFLHKDASRLTRSEAALLAAVLPAPKRFRVDAPSNYVRRRQAWIERQMASLGGTAYVQGLD